MPRYVTVYIHTRPHFKVCYVYMHMRSHVTAYNRHIKVCLRCIYMRSHVKVCLRNEFHFMLFIEV